MLLKRLFIFSLFAALVAMQTSLLHAQTKPQDVVYLKNGSIIRGKIIEKEPNQSLKIEMSDGSVFVFKMDEIDSVHLASSDEKAEKGSQKRRLYIGARAGSNLGSESDGISALELNPAPDQWNLPKHQPIEFGILAGGQLDYWFSDNWVFSAQLLYDQKGASMTYFFREEATNGARPDTLNVTLNYLEIPILLKAKFGSGNLKPYVFAGPSIGILLSGKEQNRYGVINESEGDKSVYLKNQPSISAVAGLGLSDDLASGVSLFFDAAYAIGLTNDSFGQVGLGYSGETLYHAASRDIRIAAGILFPLE